MKKVLIIGLLSMFSVATFADIAVLWNNKGYVADEGGGFDYVDPVLTQLIWSPVDPVGIASLNGGLVMGEFELDSKSKAYGYFDDNTTAQVVDNVFVGGADVTSGYLFVRVWNGAGTHYNQTMTIDPDLEPYVSTDTGTIIVASLVPIDNSAITGVVAVPEPATLGLMGVAGLGMFLARKKARR